MPSKYVRILKTIIITGIAFIVNYGINLVLTPYIMKNVGTEAYGFVSLAKNFAQYATIITTALNSYAARYIAVDYHKNEIKKANIYFNSVLIGDIFIGSVIFALACIFTIFMDSILHVDPSISKDVKILFILTFVNFWIVTVSTVFGASAYIKNRLDYTGIFKGISYTVEAIVLVLLYRFFSPYVFYVGIGLIAASLVVSATNFWINKKFTPELIIDRKRFSIKAIKRLVIDGIWTSINSLGNLLNSGLDLIVCNLLLTELAMGQLAIAKTIETIFAGLLQLVATAFQPLFLKSYAEDNKTKLLSELKTSMKMGGLLSNLAFALFVGYGLAYYKLWIPGEDIELVYKLTVVTVLASVASGPMVPLYYIYTLTIKKVFPCIVTIAGGIINVLAMHFLISNTTMGIYAVVWTTAVVMSIINIITNPLYMAHVLGFKWWVFFPNIIRNIISCGFITVAIHLISNVYTPSSWVGLIICLAVTSVVGCIIHGLIVMEKRDYEYIVERIFKRG